MAKHSVLNNVTHKDTKVLTHCSAQFGHAIGAIQVLPNEFTRAQCEYPILFLRDQNTQEFNAFAIVGLHNEENLFLDEKAGWRAGYIPNIVKKGPFSIGFQNQTSADEEDKKAVILIDEEDPRVNTQHGQPVFLEMGGNSAYLESMQNTLAQLDEGAKLSAPMFAAFKDLDLLEACVLDVKIDEENAVKFEGYHTINLERLGQLAGNELEALNKAGLLSLAFAAANSLFNIEKLVKLKRQKLKADISA